MLVTGCGAAASFFVMYDGELVHGGGSGGGGGPAAAAAAAVAAIAAVDDNWRQNWSAMRALTVA